MDETRVFNEVTLTWVGGEDAFALTMGGLRAVQEVSGCGPMELLRRMNAGEWRTDDLRAVLRFGLEGGGKTKDQARDRIDDMFTQHGLLNFVLPCVDILQAALVGVKGDPLGVEDDAPPADPLDAEPQESDTDVLLGKPQAPAPTAPPKRKKKKKKK